MNELWFDSQIVRVKNLNPVLWALVFGVIEGNNLRFSVPLRPITIAVLGLAVALFSFGSITPAHSVPFESPYISDQQTGGGAWLNAEEIVQPFRVAETGFLSHTVVTVETTTPALVSASIHLADGLGNPTGAPLATAQASEMHPVGAAVGNTQQMQIQFSQLPELSQDATYAMVFLGGHNPAASGAPSTALSLNPLVMGVPLHARGTGYTGTGRLNYQIWFVTVANPVAPDVQFLQCGVLPTVTPATTSGVTYTESRSLTEVVIVATPNDGVRFPVTALTQWSFTAYPCEDAGGPNEPAPNTNGDPASETSPPQQPTDAQAASATPAAARLAATGMPNDAPAMLSVLAGGLVTAAALVLRHRSRTDRV